MNPYMSASRGARNRRYSAVDARLAVTTGLKTSTATRSPAATPTADGPPDRVSRSDVVEPGRTANHAASRRRTARVGSAQNAARFDRTMRRRRHGGKRIGWRSKFFSPVVTARRASTANTADASATALRHVRVHLSRPHTGAVGGYAEYQYLARIRWCCRAGGARSCRRHGVQSARLEFVGVQRYPAQDLGTWLPCSSRHPRTVRGRGGQDAGPSS